MRLPKEAYWTTKVLFSNTPGVHIVGHWNYEEGTVKNIYVAANNVSTIDLYINDVLVETGKIKTNDYLYTYSNVAWQAGTIRVEGKNKNGEVVATDSITTHGDAVALKITPTVGPQGLLANGSDILLLDIEAVDSNGNRCLTFDGQIENKLTNFEINDSNGCSIWRGGYNSGLENSINNKHLYLEAGITRVAVKTTMKAGNISVTATTDGLTSATYNISSVAVDNINGYSETANEIEAYSLTSLSDPGYGTGAKLGEETENIPSENNLNSELIENYSYSGPSNTVYQKVLDNEKKMYIDETYTFRSVPYELLNAEYIQFANADKGYLAVDLVNFIAKKDIDVFVFRLSTLPDIDWITNEFTKTEHIVTGTNNKIYNVYKKSVTKGNAVTLGSNADTGTSGDMYVVAIKETAKVNNKTFFKEEFNAGELINNWNIFNVENAKAEESTDGTNGNVKYTDKTITDMTYMTKEYAKLNDIYTVSFRANLTGAVANDFLRIWQYSGEVPLPSSSAEKDGILNETYLRNNGMLYKDSKLSGIGAQKTIASNISTDEWHTYKITMNTNTSTFAVSIDGVEMGNEYKFLNNKQSSDHIVIGSGKIYESDFYMDDIEITPVVRTAITGININGEPLTTFNTLTKEYRYIGNINAKALITIDKGENYKSHTISVNTQEGYATVTVTDIDDYKQVYTIYLTDNTSNIVTSIKPDSALVGDIKVSNELLGNISYNKILQNGANMYLNETTTFTSVPYRYINAEYLILKNTNDIEDGKINVETVSIETNRQIDLLLFVEKNAVKTMTLDGYTDTKDIVTGSNGKVYKVYKKTLAKGTVEKININDIVFDTNGYNSIIALKETSSVNASIMMEEQFSRYSDIDFKREWTTLEKSASETDTGESKIGIVTNSSIDGDNQVVHLESTSSATTATTGSETMAYMYKEVPKQYRKYEVNFEMYADMSSDIASADATYNKFLRIWLYNGDITEETMTGTKTDDIIAETYITRSTTNTKKQALVYRTKIITKDTMLKDLLEPNIWMKYKYIVDMEAHTIEYYMATDGINFVKLGSSSLYSTNRDCSQYIVFGTGKNNKSSMYLRNMAINEIEDEGTISDIKIDGVSVNNYNTNTSDYLVLRNDATNEPVVEITPQEGFTNYTSSYDSVLNAVTVNLTTPTNSKARTYTVYLDTVARYTITTAVKGEGGTISPTEPETVVEGQNSKNEIIVTPNDGYEIKTITINEDGVNFTPDENGVVTLPAFTNVTEDKGIVATFMKNTYGYKVEYYYDNVKDDTKTDSTKTATFGSTVNTYEDKIKDGYKFDKVEGCTITSVAENNIVKVYYVTTVVESEGVIVHYYEYGTTTKVAQDITLPKTGTANVGEDYKTEEATGINEKYELVAIPTNANGKYEKTKIEVIYYYKVKTYNITTTSGEGGTISGKGQAPYEEVKYGENVTKEIKITPNKGYEIDTVKINNVITNNYVVDENGIGTLNTIDNVKENKEINVTFKKIAAKVIIKYINTEGKTLLPDETLNGYVGETYLTVRKDVTGYIAYGEEPTNKQGEYTKQDITVTYVYRNAKTGIIVKYLDENNNIIEPSENVDIEVGKPYNISRKDIEGYEAYGEEPTNQTGTYKGEPIEVIFYYEKIVVPTVTVKYLEKTTNNKLAEDTVITGKVGDSYTAVRKTITNYKSITPEPINKTGFMIKGEIEVIFYYEKILSKGVIVSYLEKGTNKKLAETITITGSVGDSYSSSRKVIANYKAVAPEPTNTTGKMTEALIEVKYYYQRQQSGTITVEYKDVDTNTKLAENKTIKGLVGVYILQKI